jgi:hypothetical protein
VRWKLVIIVSLIAAIVAFCLWEIAIALIFGGIRPVQSHNWFLLASALIPLGLIGFAGVFVYRHTARKRKTQAVISSLLTLVLFVAAYFLGSTLSHNLRIPAPCRLGPCA